MATKIVTLFPVIFLLLLPFAAAVSPLAPLLSPFTNEVCNDSLCGNGTCKFNPDVTFPFICECDPGWKHLPVESSDFQFLPCVVPNCTVNIDCNNTTPAPAPSTYLRSNRSLTNFHVCDWAYCAEGSCVETDYGHKCICNKGASNLMNITYLPCYSDCYLGADCSSKGIFLGNSSTTSRIAPSGSSNSSMNAGNHGCSSFPRYLLWLIALASFAVARPWM